MNSDHIAQKSIRTHSLLVFANCLILAGLEAMGFAHAATLNVTEYGARGDAIRISVNCVTNSSQVTSTNQFSTFDVGKIIEIFGAGPQLTPTNNFSDIIATIRNVTDATNITLDRVVQNTTNAASAIYGTECSPGFQACIEAASNSTINIPAGNYMLIPPALLATNFIDTGPFQQIPAVTISKGGIHFLGSGRTNTILIGNGAWRLYPNVIRGFMFFCQGPVTNDGPIIFENLTMDGGVGEGRTSYQGWPANLNGDGWDVTHGAVLDTGSPPFHKNKQFLNCNIVHWRGEMFKSVCGQLGQDGFIGITNCSFIDGNASAINFSFTHVISGCTFSNLDMAMEFYEGYCFSNCLFESSFVTNVRAAFVIVGAGTNHPQPSYTIRNNDVQATSWGIDLSPAQNVIILGNYFHDLAEALLLGGAGGQGSAAISNIVFINNVCTNAAQMLLIYTGSYVYVTNNLLSGGLPYSEFANGNSTDGNVFFYNNEAVNARGGLDFPSTSIVLPYDDISDNFPYHVYNDFHGVTNLLSYRFGVRQYINQIQLGSVWCLDDTTPSQMPTGAQMIVTNGSGLTVSLYGSAKNQIAPITMTNRYSATFRWINGAWQFLYQPAPPTDLHIISP